MWAWVYLCCVFVWGDSESTHVVYLFEVRVNLLVLCICLRWQWVYSCCVFVWGESESTCVVYLSEVTVSLLVLCICLRWEWVYLCCVFVWGDSESTCVVYLSEVTVSLLVLCICLRWEWIYLCCVFVHTEDNARIMVEERCINDVANALGRHMHSVPLVTAASVTLMSLLLEGKQTFSVITWRLCVKQTALVLQYTYFRSLILFELSWLILVCFKHLSCIY